jgi:hypothetical protein
MGVRDEQYRKNVEIDSSWRSRRLFEYLSPQPSQHAGTSQRHFGWYFRKLLLTGFVWSVCAAPFVCAIKLQEFGTLAIGFPLIAFYGIPVLFFWVDDSL